MPNKLKLRRKWFISFSTIKIKLSYGVFLSFLRKEIVGKRKKKRKKINQDHSNRTHVTAPDDVCSASPVIRQQIQLCMYCDIAY